jgi:hypothetical protein
MAVMLERWNDDRMDALEAKVDGLGEQMREQRREMRELGGEVRQETRELRQDMKASFERLYRVLIFGVLTLTGGFLAGFGGLIALVVALH